MNETNIKWSEYNPYWRGMVKSALGCDDDYAIILLNWQYTIANGPDFSEAGEGEIDNYWKWIHSEYQSHIKGGVK